MDNDNSLQLYLKLDEIIEEKVIDSSGNDRKGTVYGNPEVVDDDFVGKCLSFDGVDDYLQLPSMHVDYSQGLTIEAWVYYQAFHAWSRIVQFGNDEGNDEQNSSIIFTNYDRINKLAFQIFPVAGSSEQKFKYTTKEILLDKQWQHLAVTVDNSGNVNIYNNGQSQAIRTENKALLKSVERTQNFVGKSIHPSDELFKGKIASLRLYNRPLSPQEIKKSMLLKLISTLNQDALQSMIQDEYIWQQGVLRLIPKLNQQQRKEIQYKLQEFQLKNNWDSMRELFGIEQIIKS